MDDDQQNEPGLLLAWILGIAVTIAIVVAVLTGVLGALNSAGGSSAAPAAATSAPADKPAGSAAAPADAGVKLYFASGKAELPADAAATLAPLIDALKSGKAKKLVISGYHDASGDPAQNAELAKQRAFAVRDALTGAGLTAEQIELSKPQETTGGGDEREARRVEVSAQQ